ncbi:MAG: hypothetical protein ACP5TY_04715 [Thermodesulforhabdaceae bacterium]|jgi:archaellum component FlaC
MATVSQAERTEIEKEMEKYPVATFADILRALRQHPEWLEELRRLILTSELLELPRKFDELLKRFDRLEERVGKIEEDVAVLKQDVAVLKQDVAVLKQDVAVLKQDVAVLKQDVAVLKQDVAVLKQDVAVLKQDVEVLKRDVAILKQDVENLKKDVAMLKEDVSYMKGELGRLKGKDFERTVRERYYSYFGRLLRKSRLVPFEEIVSLIDDLEDQGRISSGERDSLLKLDMVVKGQIRESRKPVVLAVEVSYSLYEDDILRAAERADILARMLTEEVIPVVVASEFKEGAEKVADDMGVLIIKAEY